MVTLNHDLALISHINELIQIIPYTLNLGIYSNYFWTYIHNSIFTLNHTINDIEIIMSYLG